MVVHLTAKAKREWAKMSKSDMVSVWAWLNSLAQDCLPPGEQEQLDALRQKIERPIRPDASGHVVVSDEKGAPLFVLFVTVAPAAVWINSIWRFDDWCRRHA